MLTPDKINWKFTGHISSHGQSIRAYRDDQHGIEKEVVARINKGGVPTGNVNVYFFINDDKRSSEPNRHFAMPIMNLIQS